MKVKLMVIVDDEYIAGHYTMYIGTKSGGLRYGSDCIEGLAECFVDHIKHDTKFKKLFKDDIKFKKIFNGGTHNGQNSL